MIDVSELTGVWFIYDGDCPICKRAAEAPQIKQSLGDLHLLDARIGGDHPLLVAVNNRGLNLDDGMVIFHGAQYFHGTAALEFMAVHGAPKGLFNHINRLLFRSKLFAATLYPLMCSGRNSLLKLRGKPLLFNLEKRNTPIFQSVFGDDWPRMPPVMHLHYANRPYGCDISTAKGTMSV